MKLRDIKEYFSDSMSGEQVEAVLKSLGAKEEQLSNQDHDYEEDSIEQIEDAFANQSQAMKVLAAGNEAAGGNPSALPTPSQLVTASGTASSSIAQMGLPPQALATIAQIVIGNAVEQAQALGQLGEQAFVATLQNQQNGFMATLLAAAQLSGKQSQGVLSDKVAGKLLNAAVPDENKPMDQLLLEGTEAIKASVAERKALQEATTSKKEGEFAVIEAEVVDVEALLTEWGV